MADHVAITEKASATAYEVLERHANLGQIPQVSQGDSCATFDIDGEHDPTVREWLQSRQPNPWTFIAYFTNMFPVLHWIRRYNMAWMIGDVVAGITVGTVLVPQGMAYALLAHLPPQFGLYSSFMGVLIYWIFGTSKDIAIGPAAVVATVTGNLVIEMQKTLPHTPSHVVASALAFMAGCLILLLGLLRLGWLVNFISLPAINAFITGTAFNITVLQLAPLLGIDGVKSGGDISPCKVALSVLQHIRKAKGGDAAMGMTALIGLYVFRWTCTKLESRYPRKARLFFFIATLRNALVILLCTLISYLINRHHRKHPRIKILGTVPRGFQDVAVPEVNPALLQHLAKTLPVTCIVLVLEHVSIAKYFGRVHNYTPHASQELISIGVGNILGSFIGAFPATGSFSRAALQSKAGSRSPLVGLMTALVVLLAIYALPALFFFIPRSVLAAVIIHAMGDLVTSPKTLCRFWKISPVEVLIFFAGLGVAVGVGIEDGIYTGVALSLVVMLGRIVAAKGTFLERVKVGAEKGSRNTNNTVCAGSAALSSDYPIYLALDASDKTEHQTQLGSPYPGIFVFRFLDGFNYLNASRQLDKLVQIILQQTRRTDPTIGLSLKDRTWCDQAPPQTAESGLPTLKAIILDFSSVRYVDVTGIQNLVDAKKQLDQWSAPDAVEWHFANISSRWTRRALRAAGFGMPKKSGTSKAVSLDSGIEMTRVEEEQAKHEDAEIVTVERMPEQECRREICFHNSIEQALRATCK